MSALFQIFAKIWIRRRWLLGQSCWLKTYTPFCPWVSNYLGNENPGTKLNLLPSVWVYWLCIPDVTRRMGFFLVTSLCGTLWWVGSIVNETQILWLMKISPKQKQKKNLKTLSESSSESEHRTNGNFYQFIVLKSIGETPITKLYNRNTVYKRSLTLSGLQEFLCHKTSQTKLN